ncbi:MAG: hypothetical protein GF399_01640 [Candidatus Coatesbacteria bacterium]|nr:hypothetical protein [Candidatus Coatesbacteria bacterium]
MDSSIMFAVLLSISLASAGQLAYVQEGESGPQESGPQMMLLDLDDGAAYGVPIQLVAGDQPV